MCDNCFVPLHLHTNYSGDGLGTVHSLFDYASKMGFGALTVTDHGTCGGHIEFWQTAKEFGIKPQFGNEIYYLHGGKRGHITLLARNRIGYENLLKINNLSWENKDRGFPITTLEMLENNSGGLILLSGCSASPLYFGDDKDAIIFAGQMYDIFGKENFYAEVMGVYAEDNYTRPSMIAKHFGIKRVVTTDTHFVRQGDYKAHRIACISRKGFDYASTDLWLKTEREIYGTKWLTAKSPNSELVQLVRNTKLLSDEIEQIDLSAPATLPSAKGSIDIISVAKKNFADGGELHKERFDYEVGVIEKQGLVDYFTILFDIVQYCKSVGIKIGPGRGSGAGSYFLYMLGITSVDPVKNGLLFERFLDPNRSDMPDFDLDVQADRRDEVLAYAKMKWGGLPVANYSTYSHSSLVRDIGRFFNVPLWLVSETSDSEGEEQLEKFFNVCKIELTSGGETIKFEPDDARRAYETMLGQIRHRGQHAGGMVVVTRPVPIEDEKVAWTEGIKSRQLTQAGLVKYDILGVSALSILGELEKTTGVQVKDFSDSAVFNNIFKSGKLAGIFQFSGSSGISELTINLQPESIDELSAINALYRPGPMDSGMTAKYPSYKISPRLVHPEITPILEETYGVMIYQEQVMAIVAKVTGGNMADADKARKIISKGKKGDIVWEQKMRDLEEHFKTEGYKNFPRKVVDTLWSEIVTFGRYGFNKSHSFAYSTLSYMLAWYKNYYPGEFYAALLNNDSEKVEEWLISASIDGVKIRTPEINISTSRWVFKNGVLFAPLNMLKYFGEKQVNAFLALREKPFKSFDELNRVPKSVLNKRVKKQLWLAGALNSISGDIRNFIEDIDELVSMSPREREVEAIGFRLPDSDFVSFFNRETSLGRKVGFVSEIEIRNKGKGDYAVVRIIPAQTFWMRDADRARKLKEYDLISVEISNNGEAKNVWRRQV